MGLTYEDVQRIREGDPEALLSVSKVWEKGSIHDIRTYGEEKVISAVREGINKLIKRLSQGEDLNLVIQTVFNDFWYNERLKDLKPAYEEALHEFKKIEIKRIIEKLRRDEIPVSEYENSKWRLVKYAEEIKKDEFKLWQQFEIALNEYRIRHNIDREERIRELAPYGKWGPIIDLETGKIVLWPYAPENTSIVKEVLEEFRKKYGLNIEHKYEEPYWPGDMPQDGPPLEKGFWYYKIKTTEDRFDETLKIFRKMEKEIEERTTQTKEQQKRKEIKSILLELIREDEKFREELKQLLNE